jgi:hypothetical protein
MIPGHEFMGVVAAIGPGATIACGPGWWPARAARPVSGLIVDRVIPLGELVAWGPAPLAAGALRGWAAVRV